MTMKKLTIADAMDLLQATAKKEGVKLNISVESVETTTSDPKPVKVASAPKGMKDILLRAVHTINGVTYGRGMTRVPVALVDHLTYQDQQAVMNEEEFRSTKEKCYVIMKRDNGRGVAYVGARVEPEVFRGGFDLAQLGYNRMIEL